jgi:hypothetical protein
MNPLPLHPNGMKFSVFDKEGDLLATNTYFSVGGGFVVNERTQVDENLYYRAIKKEEAGSSRRDQTHGLPASQLLTAGSSLPSPETETIDSEAKAKEEEKNKQTPSRRQRTCRLISSGTRPAC